MRRHADNQEDYMLDASSTTTDWQKHPANICVLPVGSIEQHSTHLPLNTDSVFAEYFARIVAEEFDAALLPCLHYANCLEHSGFRGSLSLRPETLMQIIRDIADSLEEQGFRILVLVNGHGGNLALAPVVRDVNRMERPIKIIPVNFWEFADPSIAGEAPGANREFHAGEWETSLFLAISPALAGPLPPDIAADSPDPYHLAQKDLSLFGVSRLEPTGCVGFPSYASREKGVALVTSLKHGIIGYVRNRITMLNSDPSYSACNAVLRKLDIADIRSAAELSRNCLLYTSPSPRDS